METADPLLRTSDAGPLVPRADRRAGQRERRDPLGRSPGGDAASALRFVRSLGYYWVQRGHGEADALCREVLAMDPPPLTRQLAEAPGHLRAARGRLDLGHRPDQGSR